MSNEIEITVRGWVAQHPRLIDNARRVPMLSLRLGSTPRRFDTAQGAWADGPTEWFSVVAFRDLAENAVRSLRKGDPVLVRGRLRLSRSERDDGREYVTNEIVADAMGPELSHGTALFARTLRRDRPDGSQTTDTDGVPSADPAADLTDPGPDVAGADAEAAGPDGDPWLVVDDEPAAVPDDVDAGAPVPDLRPLG